MEILAMKNIVSETKNSLDVAADQTQKINETEDGSIENIQTEV